MTPLHQAFLDANIVAVRLLVKHGADLNKQDEDTWTPLHAACAEGYIDITRYVGLHTKYAEVFHHHLKVFQMGIFNAKVLTLGQMISRPLHWP